MMTPLRLQLCLFSAAVLVTFGGCQNASDDVLAANASAKTNYQPADDEPAETAPAATTPAKTTPTGPTETPPASGGSETPTTGATGTGATAGNADNSQDGGQTDGGQTDGGQTDGGQAKRDGDQPGGAEKLPESPYPRRVKMPELPRNADWINTRPLKMADLKGKFVVFDFWTYCCINCIHILPELKKLEHKYPNEVVVIGVHAAKFDTEKDRDNIAEAVLRYEIEHPVLVDSQHDFWNKIGVSSWPTVLVVDPEGQLVYGKPGEITFEELNEVIQHGIAHYRDNKLLDETPIRFELLAYNQKPTPLRFPGKVLADEAGNRLFVTDSNHNRIVISDLSGKVQDVIGSGKIGDTNGSFSDCSFDHPQGVALDGETLYVADTENHMLRKVDLKAKTVTTIAGIGKQSRGPWPGLEGVTTVDALPDRFVAKPGTTALNSPWALWVHEDSLYIAMAGPHQIWKMTLDEKEIGPFAGNGREDIVDGELLPTRPYGTRGVNGGSVSSFAQPSGLASDGKLLFVADSEGSSIRAVPFDPAGKVSTVIGTVGLPAGRLFAFGDVDGPKSRAKLQHCLGVTYADGKIYAVDTYNNKVKVIDAKTGESKTLAGDGKPGSGDNPPQFDEPAGIALANGVLYVADTNNHLIRTVDIKTGKVGTMNFTGLAPPKQGGAEKPDLAAADRVDVELTSVAAVDGKLNVRVALALPIGWKINELAPMRAWLQGAGDGPIANDQLGYVDVDKPQAELSFSVPVNKDGRDVLTLFLPYYYCQADGTGLCKAGEVLWSIPVNVSKDATSKSIELSHRIESR